MLMRDKPINVFFDINILYLSELKPVVHIKKYTILLVELHDDSHI
jgi:hypothetical protein